MATIDVTIKQLLELGSQIMNKSGINVSSYSEKNIKFIDNNEFILNEIKFDKHVVLSKQLKDLSNIEARNKLKNEINFERVMAKILKDQSPAFTIFAKIDDKQAILTEYFHDGSLGDHLKKGNVDLENVKLIAATLCRLHNATDIVKLGNSFLKDFKECSLIQHASYLNEAFATKHKSLIISQLSGDSIYILNKVVKFGISTATCIGPRSLDLGHLVAEYLIQYHLHMLTEENNDLHRKIAYMMIDAATITISTYYETFGLDSEQIKDFIWEVSQFAGEEIIRRADMLYPNDHRSYEISSSGQRLIDARLRITDEHRLVNIALMLTH